MAKQPYWLARERQAVADWIHDQHIQPAHLPQHIETFRISDQQSRACECCRRVGAHRLVETDYQRAIGCRLRWACVACERERTRRPGQVYIRLRAATDDTT